MTTSRTVLRRHVIPLVAVALLLHGGAATGREATPEIGVVIVAHGAPKPEWNEAAREIGAEVERQLAAQGGRMTATVALLEFARPSVADAVKQFEEAGIRKIVAVPLFIAPSGHSVLDLPCVLGLAYDRPTLEALEEEGVEIVRSDASIILSQPLSAGDILPDIMRQRAQEVSSSPAEEFAVVFAHGDPDFAPHWNELLSRVTNTLKEEGGFACVSGAFIGMGRGEEFTQQALPALEEAARSGKRVVVVALYVAMSGATWVDRGREHLPEGTEIVGTKAGALPHASVAEWVVETAKAAAAARFGSAE